MRMKVSAQTCASACVSMCIRAACFLSIYPCFRNKQRFCWWEWPKKVEHTSWVDSSFPNAYVGPSSPGSWVLLPLAAQLWLTATQVAARVWGQWVARGSSCSCPVPAATAPLQSTGARSCWADSCSTKWTWVKAGMFAKSKPCICDVPWVSFQEKKWQQLNTK